MAERAQLVNLETLRFVLDLSTILLLQQVDLFHVGYFKTLVRLRVPPLEMSPGCDIN